MHYASQYRETLKIFLFCLNPPLLAKLVTVTNQPVPRLPATSVAFCQSKYFFFSTS